MAFTTISLLLACGVIVTIARYLSHPLLRVPGPWLARFTRLWELIQIRQDHFEEVSIALHEKYGPVVRLAPNRYSISTPDAVQQIYGHSGTVFKKDRWYRPFGHPDDDQADIFSVINEQRHAANRRKVSSLYSLTSLMGYEENIDDCIQRLVGKLEKFAVDGDIINLPSWLQYFAFDVIGEITVGKSFGMTETGGDVGGILHVIHKSLTYSSRMALFNELHAWLAWFGHLMGAKNDFEQVNSYVLQQLSKHRSDEAKSQRFTRPDFIDKLLGLQKEGKVDEYDVFTTCNVNIAAGSDTIGVTLSAVFYHLCRNPQTLVQLRKEIQSLISSGQFSDPITFSEAQNAPYLQAVLKETLRMHPAVGQPLARVVPPGGAVISGYHFPAGTVVGVNAWVLHRDKTVFGPDADMFRPERWLQSSKEDIARWDRSMFAFGAGSRTCIGKNLSLLEMNKLVPQLLRKFDLTLDSPTWKTQNVFFVKPSYQCSVQTI
ncbi:putative cytochrome P450 [Acrodontium crateriforme]|uniref:Cytochrome P450 n=1 Tax=Acrodontium crateriforme TaxID=150365 RepID=A0AAQ3RAI6_9PEZI|nr:putative cytochrome P450 [Acrodontium crateriforme]